MTLRAAAASTLLSGVAAVCLAQQPAPLGDEIQVATASGNPRLPVVSGDGAGNFVVVWESALDSSGSGVFARRFDAAGTPLGPEFQVNSYTTGAQRRPAVAMNGSGAFVVVWESENGQDGSDVGVFGQRYDAGGNALGAEFRVAVATFGTQWLPSVGIGGDGSFVVVWDGHVQAATYRGVHGRRFDASGNAVGGDFFVTWFAGYTAMSMNDAGEFVVATSGMRGRRFDASANALGPDFPLETNPYVFARPSIAIDATGDFVATWARAAYVVGRSFDAFGNGGPLFAVNSYTTGEQRQPSVAMFPSGEFVVVWWDQSPTGNNDTFGRRFDAAANPLGPDFRINAYTTGGQLGGVVATTSSDTFVVAWENLPPSPAGRSIVARRWTMPADLIFADGFESGDLTAWSASQTDGGDLSASGTAAMAATTFGLEAVVDDQAGLFVQDDTPNAEGRYRARFYLDPSGYDPGEANGNRRTHVFLAFADAPLRRLVQVIVRRLDGQYALGARVRRDDGTLADTGFASITAAPHVVELDWQRASAAGANDGALALWIDGTPAGTLSGLDNDERAIDFVRLGAMTVKPGAAGTLRFDEFESRRATYIGP
jgi:hypothetical protein